MERRLSAILAADIAGYSALMGADEVRTVRDLKVGRLKAWIDQKRMEELMKAGCLQIPIDCQYTLASTR
jgi:hypothetical protein